MARSGPPELLPHSPSSAPNQVPRCQVPWNRAPTSRRILFVAEGGHGIEPRRAAPRQVAGEDGHSRKRNCGKRNRQRVVRFEAKEHRARGFAQGQRQLTSVHQGSLHSS
jgi:hypothetical protein